MKSLSSSEPKTRQDIARAYTRIVKNLSPYSNEVSKADDLVASLLIMALDIIDADYAQEVGRVDPLFNERNVMASLEAYKATL